MNTHCFSSVYLSLSDHHRSWLGRAGGKSPGVLLFYLMHFRHSRCHITSPARVELSTSSTNIIPTKLFIDIHSHIYLPARIFLIPPLTVHFTSRLFFSELLGAFMHFGYILVFEVELLYFVSNIYIHLPADFWLLSTCPAHLFIAGSVYHGVLFTYSHQRSAGL